MIIDLSGQWKAEIGDGNSYEVMLPGTLDENHIGYADGGKEPIATRFTRKYTYTGEVQFSRHLVGIEAGKKRVFLEVERARCLRLLLDEQEIPHFRVQTLSTSHIFEITKGLKEDSVLKILSDNRYEGLPQKAILDSSAATDETQTNWNGLLGFVRLRIEETVFVSNIRVYPTGETVTIYVEIEALEPWKGELLIAGHALQSEQAVEAVIAAGRTELCLEGIRMREDLPMWDEEEGNLQELTVTPAGYETKRATFGIRTFSDNQKGRLSLNERTIFLRGEANCGEFPETGHPPMKESEWIEILQRYRAYGVNCMRFHSYCPPEAAFAAADKMGMLMQPELSHWDHEHAFEAEESFSYYQAELGEILRQYANHPSFVMLTFGNELHANAAGHERMKKLLAMAHSMDKTRLFANGSNVHYGEIGCDGASDFYTAASYYQHPLRGTFAEMKGHINEHYPDARTNYVEALRAIREQYRKPVFGFEVGQFEILPDFDELEDFHGISAPVNLQLIKERAESKGMLAQWKRFVEATGELALIGYREEVEAAIRTKDFSGLFLLGLQDFPGQGTALVGMMNSHLLPKPFDFARAERFKAFFNSEQPLVLLEKYTYENNETLHAAVQIANYGKKVMKGAVEFELRGMDILIKGTVCERCICQRGVLTEAGYLEIDLRQIKRSMRLELIVRMNHLKKIYPIWVYQQDCGQKTVDTGNIYETEVFDEQAKRVLAGGGSVYLTPPSTKEALPFSIQAQFTTDFWSVGTFAKQEGGMGQFIDEKHPLFRSFPTEFHTNWQWWQMAGQRAVILPRAYQSIVMELDSYAFLRPMTQLLECRCMGGRLLFSSMGLQNLQQYPECRALRNSIYEYMSTEAFCPEQEIEPEIWEMLVRNESSANERLK